MTPKLVFYYLQSRYYDPTTYRFINADGQLNSGILGCNLFAYCNNNPVIFVDPYREFVITTALIIALAFTIIFAALNGGISAQMSGQDFWKGAAGAISGAFVFGFVYLLQLTGPRGILAARAISSGGYDLLKVFPTVWCAHVMIPVVRCLKRRLQKD
ncbi:MAG: hypothetical protein A2Y17_07070 [Clostridiales bacterium GWF2_38_85]|nr:MAG: hypothetical protein A2Y17_07070 [Clostridiales bacterium GWF2_38_85]